MPLLLYLQKIQGKGDGEWKKCLYIVLGLTRRLQVRGKKCLFLASYNTSNSLLLVARHILTTSLQNAFKVGSVNFSIFFSEPVWPSGKALGW